MSAYPRGARKSENQPDGVPANKKPRVVSAQGGNGSDIDNDDPFADDITGEEWEYLASQVELQTQQKKENVKNGNLADSSNVPFKEPQSRKVSDTTDSRLVADLKNKLSVCESKINELEVSFKRKNGETLVLRDRLSHSEKQINQEKMRLIEMQKNHEKQNCEQKESVQKQIERCKDEVQFKQAELQESQNLIRNLENKIKLLEQHNTPKSRSPVKTMTKKVGDGIVGTGMMSLHQGQPSSIASVSKKIRIVKPKSPRISSPIVLTAGFTDEPLNKVAKSSSRPNVEFSNSSHNKCQNLAESDSSHKWKLESKILRKKSQSQSILQSVISGYSPISYFAKTERPSIFQVIGAEAANVKFKMARGLTDNLKRCLVSNPGNTTLFKDYDITSSTNDVRTLLDLIKDHIKAFASYQDMFTPQNCTTTDTSSYHTAQSQPDSSCVAIKSERSSCKDVTVVCRNAVSSLEAFVVICEHLPQICQSQGNQDLLPIIIRMCDATRWSPKTEAKDQIVVLLLRIVCLHAEYSEKSKIFENFEPIVKIDTLIPLVTHKNIEVQCHVLDLLISLVTWCPTFAGNMVKSAVDCPSILCHITDLLGMRTYCDSESRFRFLIKSLSFLSNLIANHQRLLIEHLCFSEIYHGADSLLYSQLKSWKDESGGNEMRHLVIKSALCLLHSCVTVYPHSIPGSRRQHSHQFMMMLLRGFFKENSDESSFWNAELARIVETEVKTVLEESDSS